MRAEGWAEPIALGSRGRVGRDAREGHAEQRHRAGQGPTLGGQGRRAGRGCRAGEQESRGEGGGEGGGLPRKRRTTANTALRRSKRG